MEDLKTPVFKNYKEKQYFYRTLKRSFMRTHKVDEGKKVFRSVTNRFKAITVRIGSFDSYQEIKLTNNK